MYNEKIRRLVDRATVLGLDVSEIKFGDNKYYVINHGNSRYTICIPDETLRTYNCNAETFKDKVSTSYKSLRIIGGCGLESTEIMFNDLYIEELNLNEFDTEIESIKQYTNNDLIYKYIKYIYNKTYNLTDYISKGYIFIDEYNNIYENYENTIEELNYFLENKKEYQNLNLSFIDDISILTNNNLNKIYLSEFTQTLKDIKLNNIISINFLVQKLGIFLFE